MDTTLGVIRHILTLVGGGLVTNGTVTDGQLEIVTGAIVGIVGVVWSVFDKRKRTQAAQ